MDRDGRWARALGGPLPVSLSLSLSLSLSQTKKRLTAAPVSVAGQQAGKVGGDGAGAVVVLGRGNERGNECARARSGTPMRAPAGRPPRRRHPPVYARAPCLLSPPRPPSSLTWYGVTELKLFSATHQAAAMAAGTPTTRAAAAAALRADRETAEEVDGASPDPPLVLASAPLPPGGGGAGGGGGIGGWGGVGCGGAGPEARGRRNARAEKTQPLGFHASLFLSPGAPRGRRAPPPACAHHGRPASIPGR